MAALPDPAAWQALKNFFQRQRQAADMTRRTSQPLVWTSPGIHGEESGWGDEGLAPRAAPFHAPGRRSRRVTIRGSAPPRLSLAPTDGACLRTQITPRRAARRNGPAARQWQWVSHSFGAPWRKEGVARSAVMLPRDRGRSKVRAGGKVPHMITLKLSLKSKRLAPYKVSSDGG